MKILGQILFGILLTIYYFGAIFNIIWGIGILVSYFVGTNLGYAIGLVIFPAITILTLPLYLIAPCLSLTLYKNVTDKTLLISSLVLSLPALIITLLVVMKVL